MASSISRSNGASQPSAFEKWLKKNGSTILLPAIGILGFLAIWQVIAWSGLTRLPGPLSVFTDERTRTLLLYPFYDRGGLDKGLFWQTMASLVRVAQGYTIAAVVGVSLGILVGLSPAVDKALDPVFQFLRMIAPLAWVPIALVTFQQPEISAIFVIFVTAVWPILINTTVGVKQIPQDYINVKQVLQLKQKTFFFKILFPSALPYIFTGLRIAIGLSWLAIIAAEIVIGGTLGIGFFIWDAYQQNYVSEIILGVVYIGAVGLILDRAVAYIQTLILPE
ncbi:MAG: nitrate ABC transporter, permease protein [Oscillatoriales cyanobacterium]|nr:MAG: nitrate ABC transporter, permease protein [Oscillatoriales cyanobacterium]